MRQKLPSFLYERKFSPMAREQKIFCNATDLPLGNVGSIIILKLSCCNKVFHLSSWENIGYNICYHYITCLLLW